MSPHRGACAGTCILLFLHADPLQHQLPREQTENTFNHWNSCIYCKESREWYSNKLHSDKPTTTKSHGSWTAKPSPNPTTPWGNTGTAKGKQASTAVPDPTSHLGADQLLWKAQDMSWQWAPLGEAPNTQLKQHCFIQQELCPFLNFFFICKVNKNPLLGT